MKFVVHSVLMFCNHIPVPVFEERRGDQSLVFAGYVCLICIEQARVNAEANRRFDDCVIRLGWDPNSWGRVKYREYVPSGY